jgi:hypothetical protein
MHLTKKNCFSTISFLFKLTRINLNSKVPRSAIWYGTQRVSPCDSPTGKTIPPEKFKNNGLPPGKQCCGSGVFIPDPDFYQSRIPDLGSWIPDPKTAIKDRGEKN